MDSYPFDAGFSLAYVIRNILGKYYKVKMFYDDCILFGPRASHLQLVDDVLNTLADYGIHINYKKCQFMVTECTFLGHVINSQGIVPQPSKISDIVNFRKPSNLNELRTFLGMASYCRRFIKNFSDLATPLYELLKKDKRFVWSEDRDKSFNLIKDSLEKMELLHHPDFTKPFILTTDASNRAIGYTLAQKVDTYIAPIIYGGRALSKAEMNYCTTDKELLGCYYSVKKCEFYLLGNEYVVYVHGPQAINLFKNFSRYCQQTLPVDFIFRNHERENIVYSWKREYFK